MATVTVTLTSACASGGHLRLNVTGDRIYATVMELPYLAQPITDEEADAFVKVICKLAKIGRTNAQARSVLQAGVVVTA